MSVKIRIEPEYAKAPLRPGWVTAGVDHEEIKSFKRRFGWVILLADASKSPQIGGKWREIKTQTLEELTTLLNRVGEKATCWGAVCGLQDLFGGDFDWPFIFRLWREHFGDRTSTLTFRTPNGGYRPFYYTREKVSQDPFKSNLHVELKGSGRFVVVGGTALTEDGTIGKYTVTMDGLITRDDRIIEDTTAFLADLIDSKTGRYRCFNYKCITRNLTKHILLDQERSLALCTLLLIHGCTDAEIHNFRQDVYGDKTGRHVLRYSKTLTDEQIISVRGFLDGGGGAPTCKHLRSIFNWTATNCDGCTRKQGIPPSQQVVPTVGIETVTANVEEVPPDLKPATLEELHTVNAKWLHLTEADKEYLEIAYAGAIDQDIPGDSVWLYLIGPPGAMKTTAARMISKYPRVYTLDVLTKATFISGLTVKDPKTKKLVPAGGILKDLDGRVLVIKDFTAILSKDDRERNDIFGQLRCIYDGYYEAGFGSLPYPIRVKANMGLILCVTPAIDKYLKLQIALGERLLKVRQHPNPDTVTKKAYENLGREEEMRRELSTASTHYLNNLDFTSLPTLTEEQGAQIVEIAKFIARGRTPVFCDYYAGKISNLETPEPEIPTRCVKQLKKLAIGLAIVRQRKTVTVKEMKTLTRVARDTIDQKMEKIIRSMQRIPRTPDTVDIAKEARLHWQTVKNATEKMIALRMVQLDRNSNYVLTPTFKKVYNTILKIEEEDDTVKEDPVEEETPQEEAPPTPPSGRRSPLPSVTAPCEAAVPSPPAFSLVEKDPKKGSAIQLNGVMYTQKTKENIDNKNQEPKGIPLPHFVEKRTDIRGSFPPENGTTLDGVETATIIDFVARRRSIGYLKLRSAVSYRVHRDYVAGEFEALLYRMDREGLVSFDGSVVKSRGAVVE